MSILENYLELLNSELKFIPIPYEITEEESHFLVSLEVPGVKKENLQISLEDSKINIKGTRNSKEFFRQLLISKSVDTSGIVAKLEDGILTLTLPKLTQRTNKGLIQIE